MQAIVTESAAWSEDCGTVDVDDMDLDEALRYVRCTCGEIRTPDGKCLNLGTCETADVQASAHCARDTAKYRAPVAYTIAGNVD